MLHPLDVIRTRLQSIDTTGVNNVPYKRHYKDMIVDAIRREGLRGMFRGTLFSMSMNVFLGMFFMVNEKLKRRIQSSPKFERSPKIASVFSTLGLSFTFAVLYSPFYVVRTWLLLDINKGDQKMSSL